MKLIFRWYGQNDQVTLENIRQIPLMSGVVSAIYDVPAGAVWPMEKIHDLKTIVNDAGLEFEVVESVPVHEHIKLGLQDREQLIENYCENIRRLGSAGIKVICYNFMPVFDWLRTDLKKILPDGSHALAYDNETALSLNPLTSELSLPGWDESYTKEELRDLLNKYQQVNEEKLWENLRFFIHKIIPAAEEAGVKMAIHPDDPPWSIFGLPRIITNEENLHRFLRLSDQKANGLTFCTGSLGADPDNDLNKMIRKFSGRIHFVHLRNIAITGYRCFEERAHPTACGSLDMYKIVKTLYESNFNGYIRPDHGRMIWGETGRYGYGLFDRALGVMYIAGLWEAVSRK